MQAQLTACPPHVLSMKAFNCSMLRMLLHPALALHGSRGMLHLAELLPELPDLLLQPLLRLLGEGGQQAGGRWRAWLAGRAGCRQV